MFLCDFPANAKKEDGVDVCIQDLAVRCKNAVVIAEDDEAARTLAERGPAVYVFMSSKDIYKLKNRLKNFQ